MPEIARDPLSAAEPTYREVAAKASMEDILERLSNAEKSFETVGVEPLVRAILLCGVFGRGQLEHAPAAIELLNPYLAHSSYLVRLGVGAAAVELGRESPVGAEFRNRALAGLLMIPVGGSPDETDMVRGWVLNAIADNAIPVENELKDAVFAVAAGKVDSTPDPAVRDKARGLLEGERGKSESPPDGSASEA